MTPDETPIHLWAEKLEAAFEECPNLGLDRVSVLASTASTQDAAFQHAGGAPGLLCVANRQTGGRGRLGRSWADDHGRGVSMSLVLSTEMDPGGLSLAAGVAVAEACAEAGRDPRIGPRVGLRWPNDVVDRVSGAKIAGILIERKAPCTLLGIGVNAHQDDSDWQRALQGGAVSLAQLGGHIDRLELMTDILRRLETLVAEDPKAVVKQWLTRDTLTGTSQTFEHDGKRVSGLVESIDPSNTLVVRTTAGLVRLPAHSTSLVHQTT